MIAFRQRMLKQLFKKVQVYFLFLLYYSINNNFIIFKNMFRKLIKFSLIFFIKNKKIFFSEKLFVKVNLL
jgi:hypothetical protein